MLEYFQKLRPRINFFKMLGDTMTNCTMEMGGAGGTVFSTLTQSQDEELHAQLVG